MATPPAWVIGSLPGPRAEEKHPASATCEAAADGWLEFGMIGDPPSRRRVVPSSSELQAGACCSALEEHPPSGPAVSRDQHDIDTAMDMSRLLSELD